jgi:DNA adenine methylase
LTLSKLKINKKLKKEIKLIEKQAKPFLRWAGGKKWLLKQLESIIEINKYNTYHESFVGGGSVFFKFSPKSSFISDSNEWLIETYNLIKENPYKIIEHLEKFSKEKEDYYKIRSENYTNKFKRSAQFIYLNQMSFNGIFRVNLSGKYNVPYGNRREYNFDCENIISVSSALKNTHITHSDFSNTIDNVEEGDLVFLDPPYTITHNLNGFVQYNQKIFSLEDQYKLAEMIDESLYKKVA